MDPVVFCLAAAAAVMLVPVFEFSLDGTPWRLIRIVRGLDAAAS